MAAGDIPNCSGGKPDPDAVATSDLLGPRSGIVAPLGDANNDHGELAGYVECYGPTWGRYKSRTRPAPGNHDYMTTGAANYFAYFGGAAGPRGKGYYSYTLGTWHVVVLNSNCTKVAGGCGAGSTQERWLRADLAAHPTVCTLAYWHHPLFSSSAIHGGTSSVRPLFQALYDYGAEIVLNGHNHQYERFAEQTATGVASSGRGVRQFEVGVGGKSHYPIGTRQRNSEVLNNDTFGVLRLTLGAGAYEWRFLPVAGKTFTDTGATQCH